ncbi:MAG: hypothetical protein ABI557_08330, partial [Aureliella sp.]
PAPAARFAREYCRKHGKITREASIIDDAIRILRKHYATVFLDDFGPIAMEPLREKMISQLNWSRNHINKQVSRLVRIFKWAASKELVDPKVPMALAALSGLKKGRCEAKETKGVSCVDDTVDRILVSEQRRRVSFT